MVGGNAAKDGCIGRIAPAVFKQGSDTMKPWQLTVLGVVLLAIAGCRADSAARTAWEREDRFKEDRIYQLQDRVCELEESLQTCQDQLRRLKTDEEPETRHKRGSTGLTGGKPPEVELPSHPSSREPESLKHPRGSVPSDIPEAPEDIQGPSPNRSSYDGPSLERGSERLSSRPTDNSMAASASAAPFSPSGDSRRVASIALDRTLTGGIGSSDGSGDQGLLVVVVPHDADGRTIDAPAAMNVAVFDPAFAGDAARLARWDFTAAETAGLFRHTGAGAAIHLAMGWPKNPPKHRKLRLYIRYTTADGRPLEANGPIEIALPGDRKARWTPVEAPAGDGGFQQREPRAAAWQPSESSAARIDDAPLRMASRPERPVWSPERR